jgi:hypothetical protein
VNINDLHNADDVFVAHVQHLGYNLVENIKTKEFELQVRQVQALENLSESLARILSLIPR